MDVNGREDLALLAWLAIDNSKKCSVWRDRESFVTRLRQTGDLGTRLDCIDTDIQTLVVLKLAIPDGLGDRRGQEVSMGRNARQCSQVGFHRMRPKNFKVCCPAARQRVPAEVRGNAPISGERHLCTRS